MGHSNGTAESSQSHEKKWENHPTARKISVTLRKTYKNGVIIKDIRQEQERRE